MILQALLRPVANRNMPDSVSEFEDLPEARSALGVPVQLIEGRVENMRTVSALSPARSDYRPSRAAGLYRQFAQQQPGRKPDGQDDT